MKFECPKCGAAVKIVLVQSKRVTECTVPTMMRIMGPGGRDQYHTYDTDRMITWQCTSKKCDQSKKIN